MKLNIEPTDSSPAITYDEASHVLRICGESYPENAYKCYTPLLEWLRHWQHMPDTMMLTVEVHLIYFNSSSSKVLMNLFDALEACSERGALVQVRWLYDEGNETARECGEEFAEDVQSLPFEVTRIDEREGDTTGAWKGTG